MPVVIDKDFETIHKDDAAQKEQVLKRQLQALETIAGQTANAWRRQALRKQADLIAALAERTILSPHDGAGIKAASVCLFRVLDTPCREHASPSEKKPEIS